ncbi:MAG: ferrous iron transport protein B [Verrucomicrobia bacterium]|nr:ferrous iron transport protein B [Verrucomicrobiota bacterium]
MEVAVSPAPKRTLRIALIGNPNTGKTTIFNNLTGLRQRTGNYPGVTVSRKAGTMKLGDTTAELLDLPGTYSLSAHSPDERVVIDVLNGRFEEIGKPDLILFVADATNLRRNLFLASQVATLKIPMVLILNQWDSVARSGQQIDLNLLKGRLAVPVIPTVGTKGKGTEEIKKAVIQLMEEPKLLPEIKWPESMKLAIDHLKATLPCVGEELLSESETHRLLFDTHSAEVQRLKVSPEEAEREVVKAREFIRKDGMNPLVAEAMLHYRHIDGLIGGIVLKDAQLAYGATESIDRLLLHRGWGLAAFVAMMYVVFQAVYSWAGPVMDVIEAGKIWAQNLIGPALEGTPMLKSLVLDGVIEGVGAFLIFLPQILILFAFISLLEDSGYMARAAFIMDKLFSWCGLNGKSFVPLLSSYACAIPGIMATRTIEDPKARLTTVFVAPFMSCSARLPVYILCIGAFIEPVYGPWWAGFTLFLMHFVGVVVAVPTAWFVTRFILKTRSQPFIMELPKYRAPRMRDVGYRMWQAGWEFVQKAGTIIFVITIIIWASLYFPRSEAQEIEIQATFVADKVADGAGSEEAILAQLENEDSDLAREFGLTLAGAQINQSYMGRIGKAVQPIFEPAGFDWRISISVLASYPAREVIISTLGIIYSLGGDVDEEDGHLRAALKNSRWQEGERAGTPIYTVPVVIGLMVFFALCSQCGATTSIIIKEAGIKWAVASFLYMTILAWIGAVFCYQVGTYLF